MIIIVIPLMFVLLIGVGLVFSNKNDDFFE